MFLGTPGSSEAAEELVWVVDEAQRPVGGLFAGRPHHLFILGSAKTLFGETVPLLTSLEHLGSRGAVQSP